MILCFWEWAGRESIDMLESIPGLYDVAKEAAGVLRQAFPGSKIRLSLETDRDEDDREMEPSLIITAEVPPSDPMRRTFSAELDRLESDGRLPDKRRGGGRWGVFAICR